MLYVKKFWECGFKTKCLDSKGYYVTQRTTRRLQVVTQLLS